MTPVLKWATIAVIALAVIAAGTVGAAFLGRQSITDGAEFNGIRIVKDGIVSVGVLPVGREQVALVDAGNDREAKAVLKELARRQLSADSVVAIFVTHGHGDHIGGVSMFPKARVMALAREIPMIEGREGSHSPLTRLFPVSLTGTAVAGTLSDGDTVKVGDLSVRVFAMPGHTQGSAAYLTRGVLFMGDAADITSDGRVIPAPWVFSDDQAQDRASIRGLAERLEAEHAEVGAIAFAHSGLVTGGAARIKN